MHDLETILACVNQPVASSEGSSSSAESDYSLPEIRIN